jgi:hypothetical protein
MEIKDWITLLSAFIVALGWFITGFINRIQSVAQKRLEYRLGALETFLPIGMALQKKVDPFKSSEFCELFELAQVRFQLFGYADEAKLMSDFVQNLHAKDRTAASKAYVELANLVRIRIRSELKING